MLWTLIITFQRCDIQFKQILQTENVVNRKVKSAAHFLAVALNGNICKPTNIIWSLSFFRPQLF